MSSQPTERKTLADIIMEKINEKKTEIRSQISGRLHLDFCRKKTCNIRDAVTHTIFTCSKSTKESLGKDVKYVQS